VRDAVSEAELKQSESNTAQYGTNFAITIDPSEFYSRTGCNWKVIRPGKKLLKHEDAMWTVLVKKFGEGRLVAEKGEDGELFLISKSLLLVFM
jgi:hypothetical protein